MRACKPAPPLRFYAYANARKEGLACRTILHVHNYLTCTKDLCMCPTNTRGSCDFGANYNWKMSRQLRLSLSRDPQGPPESKKRQLSSQKTLDKPPAKRPKQPGEVYLDTYKAPPGITNPANNCYCNAVIQCLFNNAHFSSQLKKVFSRHPDHCTQQCCSSGMNNIIPRSLNHTEANCDYC